MEGGIRKILTFVKLKIASLGAPEALVRALVLHQCGLGSGLGM